MRTSLLFALLAASAIVPAVAGAQDWHRDHGNQNARGQERQAREQAHVQGAQQPVYQAPPQQVRTEAAQAPVQQQYQRRQDGVDHDGYHGRGDFQQVQPHYQQRPQVDGQDGRWNRQTFRRDRTVEPYRQSWAEGRPTVQHYDRDDRGRRGGTDWRDQNRGRQGFGSGGTWNRDWRRNDRYDYGRYRNDNRHAFHLPRYYAPQGWNYGYRRFSIGLALDPILFGQSYWIGDADDYRLPPAYGPYRWVRYYNDALLVDIRSGEVVDTVYDIFW